MTGFALGDDAANAAGSLAPPVPTSVAVERSLGAEPTNDGRSLVAVPTSVTVTSPVEVGPANVAGPVVSTEDDGC